MRRSLAAISFGALGLALSAVAAASDKGGLTMGDDPTPAPIITPPVISPVPESPTCPESPAGPVIEFRAAIEPPKPVAAPIVPTAPICTKEVAPAIKRNVLKVVAVMTITTIEEGKPVTRVLFLVEGLRKGERSAEEALMAIPFPEALGFSSFAGTKATGKGLNPNVSPLVRCYGVDAFPKWQTYAEREKKRLDAAKSAEKTTPKSDTASVLNAAAKGAMFLGGLTP